MNVVIHFENTGFYTFQKAIGYMLSGSESIVQYGCLTIEQHDVLRMSIGGVDNLNISYARVLPAKPKILVRCDLAVLGMKNIYVHFFGSYKDLNWNLSQKPNEDHEYIEFDYGWTKQELNEWE